MKELGEDSCSDLLPWLMETLISESSSVDRSGAAQGKSLLPSLLKTSTTLYYLNEPRNLRICSSVFSP